VETLALLYSKKFLKFEVEVAILWKKNSTRGDLNKETSLPT